MDRSGEDIKSGEFVKGDWVRLGELQFQAKSKRVWQWLAVTAIAVLLIAGLVNGWLYMEQRIRFVEMEHRYKSQVEQNRSLAMKLKSVNDAIKRYSQVMDMARNEKNQLTVERGILKAQVQLLMSEIEGLQDIVTQQQEQQEDSGVQQQVSKEPEDDESSEKKILSLGRPLSSESSSEITDTKDD